MADIIFPGDTPLESLGINKLPNNVDLSIWKGDAQTYIINMKDGNGDPIDLGGYIPQAVIRQSFTAPDTYAFTCTVHDGNQVTLYLPSSVSKSIPAGSYIWNFQLTDSVSGDVRTYLAGDVTVYAEVDA